MLWSEDKTLVLLSTMQIFRHIANDIKPLDTQATVADVFGLMEELKCSHLPVLHEGKYIGVICEDDLLDIDNDEDSLNQHLNILKPYSALATDQLFNAIRIIGEGKLSLLPVLNEEGKYIGYISPQEVLQDLGRDLTYVERGSVLVLEVHIRDYHLSQVAQIVESEDARIIGLHVKSDATEFLKVVLKINETDLSRIIKAFERYEYRVLEVFHQSIFDQTASDRYNSLINYLNI